MCVLYIYVCVMEIKYIYIWYIHIFVMEIQCKTIGVSHFLIRTVFNKNSFLTVIQTKNLRNSAFL